MFTVVSSFGIGTAAFHIDDVCSIVHCGSFYFGSDDAIFVFQSGYGVVNKVKISSIQYMRCKQFLKMHELLFNQVFNGFVSEVVLKEFIAFLPHGYCWAFFFSWAVF